MANETTKNKPKNYKAGGVQAAVWTNKSQTGTEFKTVNLDRAYKDKENNWQRTSTLRISDLPKAITLLQQIYNDEIMNTNEDAA